MVNLKRRIQKAEEAAICRKYDDEKYILALMKKMSGEDNGEAFAALLPTQGRAANFIFQIYIEAKHRLLRSGIPLRKIQIDES